jgi:hypothetical protein
MKVLPSLPTKFIELYIVVKNLKGFTFSTRQRLCLVGYLANRFMLR